MEKLNSYWLLKQNNCDILCKIQDLILENQSCCILDALGGRSYRCMQSESETVTNNDICHKCIQKWMSTERK